MEEKTKKTVEENIEEQLVENEKVEDKFPNIFNKEDLADLDEILDDIFTSHPQNKNKNSNPISQQQVSVTLDPDDESDSTIIYPDGTKINLSENEDSTICYNIDDTIVASEKYTKDTLSQLENLKKSEKL